VIRAKAVLFDLAGTLISMSVFTDHRRATAKEFARIAGLDESDDEGISDSFDRGSARYARQISKRQFYSYRELFATRYSGAARSLGVELGRSDAYRLSEMWWKGCSARFQELGLTGGGLRPGTLDTLRGLKARGFHLGLVSNMDEGDFQDFLAVDDFASHFDASISSEAARSCKPDAAIFNIALQQAGCRAEEAFFVGDTPTHDIDGAASAGMQAVLIHDEFESVTRGLKSSHPPHYEISELPELLELLV